MAPGAQSKPQFGTQILSAMVRRLLGGGHIPTDLILVGAHPCLDALDQTLLLEGTPWRVTQAQGELSLRAALPRGEGDDPGPLVATIPQGFVVPRDLGERSWKRHPLVLRAEDVVSAATGRPTMRLQDNALIRSVFENALALSELASGWSLGALVTEGDVREMVAAAALGSHQTLGRAKPAQLLGDWILKGLPTGTPATLQTLETALGTEGRWLADALRQGDLKGLVAAGALSQTPEGRSRCGFPGLQSDGNWRRVRELVTDALELAFKADPQAARDALTQAEAIYGAIGTPSPERHPLLEGALKAGWAEVQAGCEAGTPPEDDIVTALKVNLHWAYPNDTLGAARDLCRLARFIALPTDTPEATSGATAPWVSLAKNQSAWADLAIRRLRRRSQSLPDPLAPLATTIINGALKRRDAQNAAFAAHLAEALPAYQANADCREGYLPLHRLSQAVIRPLLKDGHRVLMLVLDGCDLSTFYELSRSLPEGLGLMLPQGNTHEGKDLLHDLGGPMILGVSPIPTVTANGRRALFAGEIPGRETLNQGEKAATNASGDKKAFAANPSLGTSHRILYLKGDLYDDGAALREHLKARDHDLIAVVLNGIDDALSSKQTTAMEAWSWGRLGARAKETLTQAIASGWAVLVTSDHGHTPHIAQNRKRAPKGAGQRYGTAPIAGSQAFPGPASKDKDIHCLTQVGAWIGGQRRGYHGGAGLEEVMVPIAFIGKGGLPAKAPHWWTTSEAPTPAPKALVSTTDAPSPHPVLPAPPPPEPKPAATRSPRPSAPSLPLDSAPPEGSTKAPEAAHSEAALWEAQIKREGDLRILQHISRHGSINEGEINNLAGSTTQARRFARRIDGYLAFLPFDIKTEPGPAGKRYVRKP